MRKPHWAEGAADCLEALLALNDVVLEWGSGNSTRWLAQYVKHVYAVEHHISWVNRVWEQCADVHNVTIYVAGRQCLEYVEAIDLIRSAESRRIFIIDGWLRRKCLRAARDEARPGDIIVADDALDYTRCVERLNKAEVFREPHPYAGIPVDHDKPTNCMHELHPDHKETWVWVKP